MAEPLVRFDGSAASAEVDTTVYALTALKKAAYRIADRCSVVIGPPDGSRVAVSFSSASGGDDGLRDGVRAFFEHALDYDLRERIATETAPLRNLILAHAFSRTKLVQGSGSGE